MARKRAARKSFFLTQRSLPAPEQAERSEAVASGAKRVGVSKDEAEAVASWFETRASATASLESLCSDGALLSMRREVQHGHDEVGAASRPPPP